MKDQSYAKSLGSRLLMAVYRGIAPGEEKRALPSMDVRSRRLADGLLQLAFYLGGQVCTLCVIGKKYFSWTEHVFLIYICHTKSRLQKHSESVCLISVCFMSIRCQMFFGFWLQSDQVVDLLLNTIMLSVPLSEGHNRNFLSFSHGEYFYSLFQMTVNSELLSNIDNTVPKLMKAATHNPSMVLETPSFII